MIKITNIPLTKGNKIYQTIILKVGIFKIERISLGDKFLWRLEINHGWGN